MSHWFDKSRWNDKRRVERFIDDIDLTLQSFTQDKDEAAKYFALRVSSGELKREILKYIKGARNLIGYPSSFTWDGLNLTFYTRL